MKKILIIAAACAVATTTFAATPAPVARLQPGDMSKPCEQLETEIAQNDSEYRTYYELVNSKLDEASEAQKRASDNSTVESARMMSANSYGNMGSFGGVMGSMLGSMGAARQRAAQNEAIDAQREAQRQEAYLQSVEARRDFLTSVFENRCLKLQ